MSRKEMVTLTNMCLVENGNGQVLVQKRNPKRYSWSGLAFPGGHIEKEECLADSVVREVFEETGLTIEHPELVGIKHFPDKDGHRYFVFLYKASQFSGDLRSSDEGEVFWIDKSELPQHDLAYDLLEVLKVMEDDTLSEFFYTQKSDDDDWDRNFR